MEASEMGAQKSRWLSADDHPDKEKALSYDADNSIEICRVCGGSGKLLKEVCPLCDGLVIREPRRGDQVEARPGQELIAEGKELFGPSDRGIISTDVYTGEDGIDRFDITWCHSGLTSTTRKDQWAKLFVITTSDPKKIDPVYGDEMEVLPDKTHAPNGTDIFRPGDQGRVIKVIENAGRIEKFEMMWYRTKRASEMQIGHWLKSFRRVGTNVTMPTLGDEVSSLTRLDVTGRNFYREGDLGRVSKDSYVTASDGQNRFEVTWYRTGLTSTMVSSKWMNNYRWLRSGLKLPSSGHELQVFPSVCLMVDETEYYGPHDQGRVSRDTFTCENDGIERFEITWYRTGRTSTMKVQAWAKNFFSTGSCIVMPEVGDELTCLPGKSLIIEEKATEATEAAFEGIPFGDNDKVIKGNALYLNGTSFHANGRWAGSTFATSWGEEETWIARASDDGKFMLTCLLKVPYADVTDSEIAGADPTFKESIKAKEGESETKLKVYYTAGDRGRMCKHVYTDKNDGIEKFEVAWYRSGLVSTMKKHMWLQHLRFTEKGIAEPCLGDEVEALPHVRLTVEGREYYVGGDQGRVSKDTYVTSSDGIRRFEVTWYRTKLVSTMKTECWLRNFRPIGERVALPTLGDELMALVGITLNVDGKEYYREGDRGRVSKDVYETASDGIHRFEVTWFRTGLTSTMMRDKWMNNFRFLAHNIKTPQLGDEVEALLQAELFANGKEYYRYKDRGRVSKETYVTESDGIERFEVAWYRTGLTSTMKKDQWLRHFLFVESGIKVPTFADEVEALPGIGLTVDVKEYYKEGDRGRVSKNVYVDAKDSVERFEVTWYRTGLTSTMRKDRWLNNFRPIVTFPGFIEAGRVPRCNDEVEALPGISLTVNGKEYYVEGDKGRVVKDNYVDPNDNIERFEVTWYRTALRSTMKTHCWPRNFELTLFDSELLGDEIDFWNHIRDMQLIRPPAKLSLPTALKNLSFVDNFNDCLHDLVLPEGLLSLTLGSQFNRSMTSVLLPKSLQRLTFGDNFNQCIKHTQLPIGLQNLTFGEHFNQSLEGLSLPSRLESLEFGRDFDHSFQQLTLPSGLRSLKMATSYRFLDTVTLPPGCEISYY